MIGVSHKAYFSSGQTREWVDAVAELAARHPAVRSGAVTLFVCPGILDTAAVVSTLAPAVQVGVQDVSEHPPGAWTGEIPAESAAEIGCVLAEIGHAERRLGYGETDEVVGRKVARSLEVGLTPLVCVGESERTTVAAAISATRRQIDAALAPARTVGKEAPVLFAYEPVWAIGAPQPADADYVRAVAGALREHVRAAPGVRGCRLIYGGAAGPGLLSRIGDGVDGLFLGRFAHDPAALRAVIDEAASLYVETREGTAS